MLPSTYAALPSSAPIEHYDLSTDLPASKSSLDDLSRPTARLVRLVGAGAALLVFACWASVYRHRPRHPGVYVPLRSGPIPDVYVDPSAPRALIQDSLIPGVGYISTGVGAGLSNEIIGYLVLIRIALLTNRVPILGPFTRDADHVGGQGPSTIPFDTVFDIDHYRSLSNASHPRPLTTLAALKLPPALSSPERLGCFAIPASPSERPLGVLTGTSAAYNLAVDIWAAGAGPLIDDFVQWLGRWKDDVEPWLDREKEWLERKQPGSAPARPTEQQLCLTSDYYMVTREWEERETENWPAWHQVGRHLRFAPALVDLTTAYASRLDLITSTPWAISSGSSVGARGYVAIHARHGDFNPECTAKGGGPFECFPPLSIYDEHLSALHAQLHPPTSTSSPSPSPLPVLILSDESDPAWWEAVAAKGWLRVDHELEGTVARYGSWHPTLIDMVLLSSAKGLVGTKASTFSLLASLRVREWNDGVTIML